MRELKPTRLKAVMKERGISAAALARIVGMNGGDIGQMCNGRYYPWPGQAAKIAAALEWPGDMWELFEPDGTGE